MSLQQTLQVFELLDSASVSGQEVVDLFSGYAGVTASFHRVSGPKGQTDFVRITVAGRDGKSQGQRPDAGNYRPPGRDWRTSHAYRHGV